MTDTGIMFLDTVHFTARRHYGVVLDSEGFILGKTPMFRTREQAWIAARDMRDAIAFNGAETETVKES